jgi:alpha-1,2-mannosyltransferase
MFRGAPGSIAALWSARIALFGFTPACYHLRPWHGADARRHGGMNFTFLRRLSPEARQRWFVSALLLVFFAASVQYTIKVINNPEGSAIQRWRAALLSLEANEDVYKTQVHPNSPIMALILLPFAHMPPVVGALAWFYLKVGLSLAAIYWAFRLVEIDGVSFPPWAKACTVLLSLRPILGDLAHGNVNLLILFLVLAALYAFRCRHDLSSGLLLGLAIACKVTPALFVPYFLWKRAWRTLAGSAVGLVLFAWVVPGCLLGFRQGTDLLHSWTQQMIVPYVVAGEVYYSEHNNQSLPGLTLRLLTHSPSFTVFIDDERVPVHYHNILSLSPHAAGWIVKCCMALFAVLVVWSCRTPLGQRRGWRLPAEFAVILLGMLLFSERTWKHHCVTLLLPFAVLMYCLATCRPSPRLRSTLIAAVCGATMLMLTTSTGPQGEDLVDLSWGKLAQVYGAFVWAYILLMAALVAVLRHRNSAGLLEGPAAQAQSHGVAACPQTS